VGALKFECVQCLGPGKLPTQAGGSSREKLWGLKGISRGLRVVEKIKNPGSGSPDPGLGE
jgi:hypothetical protein